MHVKRSKEFDDNSPTKNDRKDPKTIAMRRGDTMRRGDMRRGDRYIVPPIKNKE